MIFKKNIFNKIGFYNPYFKRCQDYDLWLRKKKTLLFKHKKRLIKYNSKSQYKITTFFYTIMAILKNVSFSKN